MCTENPPCEICTKKKCDSKEKCKFDCAECVCRSSLQTTHLGKILMVGTWHFMWNTLGQRSQHSKSPPLMQTAHQSSLGSSSFTSRLPIAVDDPCPLSMHPLVSCLPEPLSPEQVVWDWASDLIFSFVLLTGLGLPICRGEKGRFWCHCYTQ